MIESVVASAVVFGQLRLEACTRVLRVAKVADFTSAEIGGFVHVDPESVIGEQVVKVSQLALPVALDAGMQKVGIVSRTRPDLRLPEALDTISLCE